MRNSLATILFQKNVGAIVWSRHFETTSENRVMLFNWRFLFRSDVLTRYPSGRKITRRKHYLIPKLRTMNCSNQHRSFESFKSVGFFFTIFGSSKITRCYLNSFMRVVWAKRMWTLITFRTTFGQVKFIHHITM